MKRLLQPHAEYPNTMSINKTILSLPTMKVSLQEFYDPHWIEILIWREDKSTGFFILRKSKIIPLSKEAHKLLKDPKFKRGKIRVDAIINKLRHK